MIGLCQKQQILNLTAIKQQSSRKCSVDNDARFSARMQRLERSSRVLTSGLDSLSPSAFIEPSDISGRKCLYQGLGYECASEKKRINENQLYLF